MLVDKEDLKARKRIKNQTWYGYTRNPSATLMKSPKIIGGTVDRDRIWTIDKDQNLLPHSTTIIIVPYSNTNIFFLLGLLNSSVCWDYIRSNSPTMGSGRYAYQLGCMQCFPVPQTETVRQQSLADQIAALTRRIFYNEDNRDSLCEEIDSVVQQLYQKRSEEE